MAGLFHALMNCARAHEEAQKEWDAEGIARLLRAAAETKQVACVRRLAELVLQREDGESWKTMAAQSWPNEMEAIVDCLIRDYQRPVPKIHL